MLRLNCQGKRTESFAVSTDIFNYVVLVISRSLQAGGSLLRMCRWKGCELKIGRGRTKDVRLLLSGLQRSPFILYSPPCIDPAPLHTPLPSRSLSSFSCPCLQLASASLHLTNPSSPQIPIILMRFIRVFSTELNICLCVYVCVWRCTIR